MLAQESHRDAHLLRVDESDSTTTHLNGSWSYARAYFDSSEPGSSAASLVAEYANICVMQTLSKSSGLAAIWSLSIRESRSSYYRLYWLKFNTTSFQMLINVSDAVPPAPTLSILLRTDSASRLPNPHSSRSSLTPRRLTTSPRRRPTLHCTLCHPRC
jgi:hypothetical protein